MTGLFAPGFTIWRAGRVADGQGGHTETFASTGQAVSGRLTPLGGGEQIRADQERGIVSHRFSCGSDVDIRKGDQVRAGTRIITVQAIRRTSSGKRIEAVCEEDL